MIAEDTERENRYRKNVAAQVAAAAQNLGHRLVVVLCSYSRDRDFALGQ